MNDLSIIKMVFLLVFLLTSKSFSSECGADKVQYSESKELGDGLKRFNELYLAGYDKRAAKLYLKNLVLACDFKAAVVYATVFSSDSDEDRAFIVNIIEKYIHASINEVRGEALYVLYQLNSTLDFFQQEVYLLESAVLGNNNALVKVFSIYETLGCDEGLYFTASLSKDGRISKDSVIGHRIYELYFRDKGKWPRADGLYEKLKNGEAIRLPSFISKRSCNKWNE